MITPTKILQRTVALLARSYCSASADLIRLHQHDGLRTISLNDPKTRNSLSLSMMRQLINAITLDDKESPLRSIVITSTSSTVFSSGHNLKELSAEHGVASQKNIFATCTELMMAIRNCPVPVMGAVDGMAAAAGCQLVAACDFAFCTEPSKFSTPGASFGLFCSTPGVTISRKVPRSTAAYMVLTGTPLTAQEALNAGLVIKVVNDSSQLQSLVESTHSLIASKSRSVLTLGKRFFYEQLSSSTYEGALVQGENTMVTNLQLTDAQEGIQSFKEKRDPQWSHGNQTVVN